MKKFKIPKSRIDRLTVEELESIEKIVVDTNQRIEEWVSLQLNRIKVSKASKKQPFNREELAYQLRLTGIGPERVLAKQNPTVRDQSKERIEALRIYCGLSYSELENILDMSRQVYRKMELVGFRKGLSSSQIQRLVTASREKLLVSGKNAAFGDQWTHLIRKTIVPLTETDGELVAKEWDYRKNDVPPSRYGSNTNRKAWWICSDNHSYQMSVRDKKERDEKSCPLCRDVKIGSKNFFENATIEVNDPIKSDFIGSLEDFYESSEQKKTMSKELNQFLESKSPKKDKINELMKVINRKLHEEGKGARIEYTQDYLLKELKESSDHIKEILIALDNIDEIALKNKIGSTLFNLYREDPKNPQYKKTINAVLEHEEEKLGEYELARDSRRGFLGDLLIWNPRNLTRKGNKEKARKSPRAKRRKDSL